MQSLANINLKLDLDTLRKNKNLILNLALIVLALIISGYIYSWQGRNNKMLEENIILENKKNDLLKNMAVSEKKLADYKKTLGKKDTSVMISKINSLAQETGLRILSIRPEQEQDFPIYTKSSIRLSIFSEDYHKIGAFVSRLESSADLYKIEALNIKHDIPTQTTRSIGTKVVEIEGKRGLSVEMLITKISFKG